MRGIRAFGGRLPAFFHARCWAGSGLGEDGKCTHQSTYTVEVSTSHWRDVPLLERRHSSNFCYVIMQAKRVVNATSLSCFHPNLSLSYVHILKTLGHVKCTSRAKLSEVCPTISPMLPARRLCSLFSIKSGLKEGTQTLFIAPLFRGLNTRGCLPLAYQ
jgi:hypothetical protein